MKVIREKSVKISGLWDRNYTLSVPVLQIRWTNNLYLLVLNMDFCPNLTWFTNLCFSYLFPPKAVDQTNLSEGTFVPMSEDSSVPQEMNKSPNHNDQSQNPNPSSPNINSAEIEESAKSAGPEAIKQDEAAENVTRPMYDPDEAVLVHLLEICKVYDLADEMGRWVSIRIA